MGASKVNPSLEKHDPQQVTLLLDEWSKGKPEALDQLLPLVYDELHSIAQRYLRGERHQHTLQPTALLNETYLRLIGQRTVAWQNRAQFFGIAGQMMRRILVDHARRHQAAKRGGDIEIVRIDTGAEFPDRREIDITALDEALTLLEELDPRQARIVELRFFAGLSVEETAAALEVSPRTVKREWRTARAWLLKEVESR